MRKWESEKHKSWGMPAETSKGHVATDGSLENDEEVPLHGMYGSMEAEYEVQRTIKRAELTAFLCFIRKVSEPIKVDVDNKGLRKGEKECIKPRAGDADLWFKIWEESHELVKKRYLGGSGTREGTPHEERKRKNDEI